MNLSDSFHDGDPVDESSLPGRHDPDHAEDATPDGGFGVASDRPEEGRPVDPVDLVDLVDLEDLVGLEERIAFLLRSECSVDAKRSVSIAASVFEASLPSLPAHTLPITVGQFSPWARRVAVASGLAAAACVAMVAMVAWIGMRPALTETGPLVEKNRVAMASDESGIFAASMGEPRDSEALLAAVLGGDGDWLADPSFTTVAFRDVRPVMDSWSLGVDDLEDEIRLILAPPAS
ncbi:MAG: hypothetical protein O3A19_07195 [Planctomycetota bacterium]|nr:hypothetical protein [Planctomycetota bacterium]